MAKEFMYYTKNVSYFVGVRLNLNDPIGRILTYDNPIIAVDMDGLRDFKIANKRAILEGLIVPTDEPNLDWEVSNAISDTEITDLLKNFLKLKARLPGITSVAIAYKILNAAKDQNKSPKVIGLIEEHISDIEELVDDPTFKRGVE